MANARGTGQGDFIRKMCLFEESHTFASHKDVLVVEHSHVETGYFRYHFLFTVGSISWGSVSRNSPFSIQPFRM